MATLLCVCAGLVLAAAASPTRADAAGCPDEQRRQERGSAALPDCRAYELVTPPQKNGGLIQPTVAPLFQVASNGQRVITATYQCFAEAQSCIAERQSQGEPYEFARTNAGWVAHPLAPPATSFEPDSWLSVNADSGTVLVSAPNTPAGEEDFSQGPAGGPFTPVGPVGEGPTDEFRELLGTPVVETRDSSHIVYATAKPFWAFDPTGHIEAGPVRPGLYEYAGTGHQTPLMVGVKGGFESHEPMSDCGNRLGGLISSRNALSEDGRTIYFTADGSEPPSICPPQFRLYVRLDNESADARSVLVSGPTPGTCTEPECEANTGEEKEVEHARQANFAGASGDGSRVLFKDGQQLTDNASESSEGFGCGTGSGCNLYEWECPHCDGLTEQQEAGKRHLVDLSEGAKESGGPRVQGVVAFSADGSHAYFVAKGVLTGNEENANHEKATDEADNLYVNVGGRLTFIAVLARGDVQNWEEGGQPANVTPDGRFLVFSSHRALTRDDSRAEEPAPAQVYEYDATTRTLIRISIGNQEFNGDGNEGTGDASIVPASEGEAGRTVPVRLDPTMSDDGAYVFFQSPIALTPQSLNDVSAGEGLAQNVYEYHDGRVSLLSDGRDTSPAGGLPESPVELLGSDPSGSSAFFATFDPLLPEDTDTQRDIYDARICSESEPCAPPQAAPPAPCAAEACHGTPPGAPAGVTPGSETFVGAGNLAPVAAVPRKPKPKTAAQVRGEKLTKALKACRRKHGSKRKACEREAHRAYHAVNRAKRASKARRASRYRKVGR
jgi:hypothetical protein